VTSQEKANWIRRIFTLGLVGAAAAAGLFFAMPDGWWKGLGKEKKKSGLQMTKQNLEELQASPNKLTVINNVVDGNAESAKLQETLKKLDEQKYDERVVMAEFAVDEDPELAERRGVKKDGFNGQLDFYANGKRLEQLVGQTDPVVVEKTIDRLLAGLVQRVGKDWLPEVPGMQRNQGQDVIPIKPKSPARTPAKS
jgi:hypothetical protein